MTHPITVGIPFYSGLDYLEEAIRSVLQQESANWRLLVADDGEEDQRVAELVESLGDERISLITNGRNLGMVRNWNQLLDRAQTDLVTLLHADDRLLPNYVKLMDEMVTMAPDAVAYFCAARIIDQHGQPVFSLPDAVKSLLTPRRELVRLSGEHSLSDLMRANFIVCPTLCFRRSTLGERRFSVEWKQVQDLELTARLLMDGETIVGSNTVAYAYRRHASSATTQQSESLLRFSEESRCFDRVSHKCDAMGWTEAARVASHKRIIKLHLLYRILKDLCCLRIQHALSQARFLLGIHSAKQDCDPL